MSHVTHLVANGRHEAGDHAAALTSDDRPMSQHHHRAPPAPAVITDQDPMILIDTPTSNVCQLHNAMSIINEPTKTSHSTHVDLCQHLMSHPVARWSTNVSTTAQSPSQPHEPTNLKLANHRHDHPAHAPNQLTDPDSHANANPCDSCTPMTTRLVVWWRPDA